MCLELTQGMYTENYEPSLKLEDRPKLHDSKDECDLCRLLYDNIKTVQLFQYSLRQYFALAPLPYDGLKSKLSTENDRYCASQVTVKYCKDDLKLSIWADEGTIVLYNRMTVHD